MAAILQPAAVIRVGLVGQLAIGVLLVAAWFVNPYLLAFAFYGQVAFAAGALLWTAAAWFVARPRGRALAGLLTLPVAAGLVTALALWRLLATDWKF